MKCLYWDKFGKVDMTALSSQLALSTLEGEEGNWGSLPAHEKARACNAVIFLAKMLCSRGEYQSVSSLPCYTHVVYQPVSTGHVIA